jgi:aryl-alcohol dehydrogenase-like predicted oxidoreductase
LEQTLRALEDLMRQGKVRHAAASNMTPALLQESERTARARQLHGFVATQEPYNLLERGIETTLLPELEQLQLSLIPYFPLASGLLTGKYRRGVAPAEGTRLAAWKNLASALTDQNFDRIERLEAFASERGRSLVELAIAWLLHQPAVASVIAGATRPSQLEANCRALDWKLSAQDMAQIDQLAPR